MKSNKALEEKNNHSTQLNSTQLNSTQLNSALIILKVCYTSNLSQRKGSCFSKKRRTTTTTTKQQQTSQQINKSTTNKP